MVPKTPYVWLLKVVCFAYIATFILWLHHKKCILLWVYYYDACCINILVTHAHHIKRQTFLLNHFQNIVLILLRIHFHELSQIYKFITATSTTLHHSNICMVKIILFWNLVYRHISHSSLVKNLKFTNQFSWLHF